MTMGSPEMQHKVRQLDNDAQAVYVMLSEIQGTQRRHTNRFQELTQMLAGHAGRLDEIDGRLDSIDAKLDDVLEILRADGGPPR